MSVLLWVIIMNIMINSYHYYHYYYYYYYYEMKRRFLWIESWRKKKKHDKLCCSMISLGATTLLKTTWQDFLLLLLLLHPTQTQTDKTGMTEKEKPNCPTFNVQRSRGQLAFTKLNLDRRKEKTWHGIVWISGFPKCSLSDLFFTFLFFFCLVNLRKGGWEKV